MPDSRACVVNRGLDDPRIKPQTCWWLPLVAWFPFAIAINSILLPHGALAYWGRWLGLIGLLAYGCLTVFVPGRWVLRRFDYWALWVFGLIALSMLLIPEESVLLAANFRMTALIKACSFLFAYLSLTWGLESLLTSFQAISFIVTTLTIGATAIFTLGVVGNLTGAAPPIGAAGAGIFVNPNMTASLAVVMLPLALWFLVRRRGWLRFLPAAVTLAALLLTRARTPLVVLTLLSLYYLLCWPSPRRQQLVKTLFPLTLIVFGLLIFASVDFWASPLAQDILEFIKSGSAGSRQPGYSSYRLNLLWPLFIKGIFDSPLSALLGHGWGSEEALLLLQRERSYFFSELDLISAHSAYIGLTYQIGLIGCIAVFLPLWRLVLAQLVEARSTLSNEAITLKVSLVGVVLAELGVCFFESGFYNVGAVHMLPAWMAVYLVTRLDEVATISS